MFERVKGKPGMTISCARCGTPTQSMTPNTPTNDAMEVCDECADIIRRQNNEDDAKENNQGEA